MWLRNTKMAEQKNLRPTAITTAEHQAEIEYVNGSTKIDPHLFKFFV